MPLKACGSHNHGGQNSLLASIAAVGVLASHELLLHMAQLVQLGHQTGGVGR